MIYERYFIYDRSHLGESVYSPIYRNYSGDYVFDIEKESKDFGCKTINSCALIVFVDEPENLIKRDDGLSFSVDLDKKQDEINRFIEAFNKSNIKKKILINIKDRSIEEVHEIIVKFLEDV